MRIEKLCFLFSGNQEEIIYHFCLAKKKKMPACNFAKWVIILKYGKTGTFLLPLPSLGRGSIIG